MKHLAVALAVLFLLAWAMPAGATITRDGITGGGGTSSAAGTYTVTLPTVANNDIVIFCSIAVATNSSGAPTDVTGTYTLVPNTAQGNSGTSGSSCYWSLWTTGNSTTLTGFVGVVQAVAYQYVVGTYSGANTSTPIDSSNGQYNSTASLTITMTSTSPTGSADYWIGVATQNNCQNCTLSSPSLGSVTQTQAANAAVMMGFIEAQLSSSGATGTQTVTSSGSHTGQGDQITLLPAAAPTATPTATATATPTATATATATSTATATPTSTATATPTPAGSCTPNAIIYLLNSSKKIMNGGASSTTGTGAQWAAWATDTSGNIVNAFTGSASATTGSQNYTIQIVDNAGKICSGSSDSATAAVPNFTVRVCNTSGGVAGCTESATSAKYNMSVYIQDATGKIDDTF